MPWTERLLSVKAHAPTADLELHTAYIPPGSSNGWIKIETFQALYRRLGRSCEIPRILCGDFNTPQEERIDGTVVTWGEKIRKNGQVFPRIRGGKKGEWDKAERSILLGLAEYDLTDVYRQMHGYKRQEFSWFPRRKKGGVPRRFDHVFASNIFNPKTCTYLRDFEQHGLSDHSPIEVVFQP